MQNKREIYFERKIRKKKKIGLFTKKLKLIIRKKKTKTYLESPKVT